MSNKKNRTILCTFLLWAFFVCLLVAFLTRPRVASETIFNPAEVRQDYINSNYPENFYEHKKSPSPTPTDVPVVDISRTWYEGKASWYGATPATCLGCGVHYKDDGTPFFRTANGEIYTGKDLTVACAVGGSCRDFPVGSVVQIMNLANNMTVTARVNDVGGFAKYNRILDVSPKVRDMLNMGGEATVRVVVL